ncbi:MAG: hypothetical protein LKI17_06375 [Megasphaera cerevisiae]|jgi:molybdopterin-binding protein|nr:hypothetical protein [Megasphaera cerevisiae]
MAVSIQDLIKQKEAILARKTETFDFTTSIGTIVVKKPTKAFVAEVLNLTEGADAYAILNSVIEPDLKSAELQKAYGCAEPTDIVEALFDAGEIPAIGTKIVQCAGYGVPIEAKVHDDVKN